MRDELAKLAFMIMLPYSITQQVDDFGPRNLALTAYEFADAMVKVANEPKRTR